MSGPGPVDGGRAEPFKAPKQGKKRTEGQKKANEAAAKPLKQTKAAHQSSFPKLAARGARWAGGKLKKLAAKVGIGGSYDAVTNRAKIKRRVGKTFTAVGIGKSAKARDRRKKIKNVAVKVGRGAKFVGTKVGKGAKVVGKAAAKALTAIPKGIKSAKATRAAIKQVKADAKQMKADFYTRAANGLAVDRTFSGATTPVPDFTAASFTEKALAMTQTLAAGKGLSAYQLPGRRPVADITTPAGEIIRNAGEPFEQGDFEKLKDAGITEVQVHKTKSRLSLKLDETLKQFKPDGPRLMALESGITELEAAKAARGDRLSPEQMELLDAAIDALKGMKEQYTSMYSEFFSPEGDNDVDRLNQFVAAFQSPAYAKLRGLAANWTKHQTDLLTLNQRGLLRLTDKDLKKSKEGSKDPDYQGTLIIPVQWGMRMNQFIGELSEYLTEEGQAQMKPMVEAGKAFVNNMNEERTIDEIETSKNKEGTNLIRELGLQNAAELIAIQKHVGIKEFKDLRANLQELGVLPRGEEPVGEDHPQGLDSIKQFIDQQRLIGTLHEVDSEYTPYYDPDAYDAEES